MKSEEEEDEEDEEEEKEKEEGLRRKMLSNSYSSPVESSIKGGRRERLPGIVDG